MVLYCIFQNKIHTRDDGVGYVAVGDHSLIEINFNDLRFPIIENVSADANTKGARVEIALTEQVSNPVRWAQSVEMLLAEEVETGFSTNGF